MSLSIIIPTKDRGEIFHKTFTSAYKAIEGIEAEIIIVNDSKTSEITIGNEFNKNVVIINNPNNGVASARNLGARNAKYEYLLFLDDDMLISEENIASYFKNSEINENFTINIEWVYPPEVIKSIKKTSFGRFLIKYGYTTMRGWNSYPDWPEKSLVLVDSLSSPNLFIKKTAFFESGGYDEHFPHAGFEDYAFSERLKSKNFKMYVDTNSIMYHNEIDRLNSTKWFNKKEREGETRKIAVSKGYGEIEIHYPFFKKLIYSSSLLIKPILLFILLFSSRFTFFDFLSFRCYKVLLGISIFKGYHKKTEHVLGKIDLMIAGAQKSGTTSLKNYLSEHPGILGHIQIEFTYFVNEMEFIKGYDFIVNKYYQFNKRFKGEKLISKSIIMYSDEKSIKRLYEHNPKCEVVLLLRNPVDRAFSSFNMEVTNGWRYTDFTVVKDAILKPTKELEFLYNLIVDLGIYSKHIQNIFKFFPKEQVHVYLFEDFVKNPLKVCHELFEILHVDKNFDPNIHVAYNKTFIKKSGALASFYTKLKRNENILKKTTKILLPYSAFTKLSYKILDINKSKKEYAPMTKEMRVFLQNFYAPSIKELEELIGVDLTVWKQ